MTDITDTNAVEAVGFWTNLKNAVWWGMFMLGVMHAYQQGWLEFLLGKQPQRNPASAQSPGGAADVTEEERKPLDPETEVRSCPGEPTRSTVRHGRDMERHGETW